MHGQFVAETRNQLNLTIAARLERPSAPRSKLGRLIMATGDPIEAAALSTQALGWKGALRSRHTVNDLRRLAQSHASLTEVADLRSRIGTVVAV